MITEALVSAALQLLTWNLQLIPNVSLPGWLTDTTTTIGSGLSSVTAFGWFIPLNAIGNSLVFLLGVTAVVVGVRIARLVLSLFTGGGGSVA